MRILRSVETAQLKIVALHGRVRLNDQPTMTYSFVADKVFIGPYGSQKPTNRRSALEAIGRAHKITFLPQFGSQTENFIVSLEGSADLEFNTQTELQGFVDNVLRHPMKYGISLHIGDPSDI